MSNPSGGENREPLTPIEQAATRAATAIGAAIRFSLAAIVLLATLVRYAAPPACAADPQPYRVDMASTEDSALDATLKATSELLTLRKTAPVSPFGLIARGRGDLDRLKTVLESFGFYQSSVAITIDGLPLDDPTLVDELNARASSNDAQVKITFSLGALYHVRRIDIDGEVPTSAAGALELTTGMPAVAADILAGGERLQTALEDQGYAFAKVDPPIAYEDPPNRVLDISFHVIAGSSVQIGDIRITGLRRLREPIVRERLLVHTGEQYGASKIERARKDLLGLGVFSVVNVEVATKADSSGRVPITFRVRERLQHTASISAAYSSDLGGSAGVNWTNRNVSGKADQLTLAASVINLGGSATTGVGYDTSAKYVIPGFKQRDQSLQVALGALKQSLLSYDQTAFTSGVSVNRKLSSIWSANAGLSAERERIDQECVTRDYTLLAVPLSVAYNTTGLDSPLEDPRHGVRASLNFAPTLSVRSSSSLDPVCSLAAPATATSGQSNARFLITQANVAIYLDMRDLGFNRAPGRSVLALRALAGVAAGASEFSLPPDQRFYAGGGGTIRGYRYQSVGPVFPDGNPIGGTAIRTGTAEFRQRIGTNFGTAVFVDAGQVSASLNPLAGALRFGAGAGVRYYTPIGPIRLDIAVPIRRRPAQAPTATQPGIQGDDAFEIYIGLGQAF